MLDLKLSHAAAVKSGACKDEGLKRLNEQEATAWAAKLRSESTLRSSQSTRSHMFFTHKSFCTITAGANSIQRNRFKRNARHRNSSPTYSASFILIFAHILVCGCSSGK